MKRAAIIYLLLFQFSASAEVESEKASWVCSQPGYVGETLTYALSKVFVGVANDYDAKEQLFEEYIKSVTEGDFDALDDPSCRDFSSEKKAEKYLEKILKRAKKKFKILWVDFGSLQE